MSLASTDQSNQATSCLSAASLRAFINKLKSPEYEAFIQEKDEIYGNSIRLVFEAKRRGLISVDRFDFYIFMTQMNGFLVLHPDDENREMFGKLSEEMAMSQEESK